MRDKCGVICAEQERASSVSITAIELLLVGVSAVASSAGIMICVQSRNKAAVSCRRRSAAKAVASEQVWSRSTLQIFAMTSGKYF
jgi:hypothetical protein